MYLKNHQVKNFKHQEKEAEAMVSLLLGNFHSLGLKGHAQFHSLCCLLTACALAHLS